MYIYKGTVPIYMYGHQNLLGQPPNGVSTIFLDDMSFQAQEIRIVLNDRSILVAVFFVVSFSLCIWGVISCSGQHDVLLLPPLIPRDTMRYDVGLSSILQQQPQSQMHPANFCYVDVYYGVCFLLSGSDMDAIFTSGGSTIGICNSATLNRLKWLLCWSIAHTGGTLSSNSLHCFVQGEPHATHPAILHLINQYGGAYTFGAWQGVT